MLIGAERPGNEHIFLIAFERKEKWLLPSNVVNDLIVFIFTRKGGEEIEGEGAGRKAVVWFEARGGWTFCCPAA